MDTAGVRGLIVSATRDDETGELLVPRNLQEQNLSLILIIMSIIIIMF